MTMRYILEGLDCSNCAAKLQNELRKVRGLEEATIHFATGSIEFPSEMEGQARAIISRVEPGVQLVAEKANVLETSGVCQEKDGFRLPFAIIFAAALFTAGLVFRRLLQSTSYGWAYYAVLLSSYFLVGWPVIRAAFANLRRGDVFGESFLMTISTVGAIAIKQLPEAVGVMLFYAVGEWLQDRAVDRSRRSISSLMDIRPAYANLKSDGVVNQVPPGEVQAGQLVLVKPGERVPLDGEVVEGESFVDTSALTGEPVPRHVVEGDEIMAGAVNGQGVLIVRVSRPFEDSSVARVLALVEEAGERKAPTEQFITSFARYYTPGVVLAAAAVAILPPLVVPGATFSQWFYRALVLLVISCPCALMVSIPLSFFGGIGGASRRGVLVKGANFLEGLSHVHTVVFDKTGTLTHGVFKVAQVVPLNGYGADELLSWAGAAETFSNHPIAHSIREACGTSAAPERVKDYQEIPGHGVGATIDGHRILAGSDRLLHREGIAHDVCSVEGTGVWVAVDGALAGYIVISDEVRHDAAGTIAHLKELGVKRTVMLTGDDVISARQVAERVGIDQYYAGLLPEDKVAKLEELEQDLPRRGRHKLAFVGDGINDAPVIARADIGIAMGALGSDAAIEAADVVLMEDAPMKVVTAVETARFTRRVVWQNLVLALGVKVFFLVLGAAGVASIWEAVFADVGVTIIAVLNAMRSLRPRVSKAALCETCACKTCAS